MFSCLDDRFHRDFNPGFRLRNETRGSCKSPHLHSVRPGVSEEGRSSVGRTGKYRWDTQWQYSCHVRSCQDNGTVCSSQSHLDPCPWPLAGCPRPSSPVWLQEFPKCCGVDRSAGQSCVVVRLLTEIWVMIILREKTWERKVAKYNIYCSCLSRHEGDREGAFSLILGVINRFRVSIVPSVGKKHAWSVVSLQPPIDWPTEWEEEKDNGPSQVISLCMHRRQRWDWIVWLHPADDRYFRLIDLWGMAWDIYWFHWCMHNTEWGWNTDHHVLKNVHVKLRLKPRSDCLGAKSTVYIIKWSSDPPLTKLLIKKE